MSRTPLAAALAAALAVALAPALAAPDLRVAEAAAAKEKAKPLTPRQQKRRDCAAKWADEKA
jgi:uncharacterized membrane protein